MNLKNSKKTGNPNEIRINCPNCGDTKYHMYVNMIKGVYHCFRCQSSGRLAKSDSDHEISKFLRKVEKFLHPEDFIEPDYPIELPEEYCKIGSLLEAFHWESVAINYLIRRGISREIAKKYDLGYCATGYYEGRLIIPFVFRGRLEYFNSRAITNQEPKYVNPKHDKRDVLFFSERRPTKTAVIVEGAFDAINVGQVTPAIALGGKEMSDAQLKRIITCTEKTIVMLDPMTLKQSFTIWMRLKNYQKSWLIDMSSFDLVTDPGDMSIKVIKKLIGEAYENLQ